MPVEMDYGFRLKSSKEGGVLGYGEKIPRPIVTPLSYDDHTYRNRLRELPVLTMPEPNNRPTEE